MDTIIFSLHRLMDRYPLLNLMARAGKGKQTVETEVDHDGKKRNVRTWILDYGRDITIPIRYSDKRNIPSSNHDVPYTIDEIGNYLEANVSVPKVIFGNNICEVVVPPGHRDYTVNRTSPLDQVDYWYDQIRFTMNKTLHAISDGNVIELDWCDVELKRIDLALNQHHESMSECFRYLELQKKLKKKHSREYGASNIGLFKTSITFKTERSYAKIYHKGSEFRDIQAKKIIKINAERLKAGVPLKSSNIEYAATHIQDLQTYSDKILRYELEFKQKYMSYLYNRKVHKQWSPLWRSAVRIFDFCMRNKEFAREMWQSELWYVDERGVSSKQRPVLVVTQKMYYRLYDQENRKWELVPFTRKEQGIYRELLEMRLFDGKRGFKGWMRYMTKELNKIRSFRMDLQKGVVDWTRQTYRENGRLKYLNCFSDYPNGTDSMVRFTKTMLDVMTEEMMKFYSEFQIVTKSSNEEFVDKVAFYNLAIDRRIAISEGIEDVAVFYTRSVDEMKRLRKLRQVGGYITDRLMRNLVEWHTWHGKMQEKELVPKYYSRATYYRIKKLYEDLTGQKEHIASVHFSNVIQRNPTRLYEKLYSDINYSFLTNFYNLGLQHFGVVKMAM